MTKHIGIEIHSSQCPLLLYNRNITTISVWNIHFNAQELNHLQSVDDVNSNKAYNMSSPTKWQWKSDHQPNTNTWQHAWNKFKNSSLEDSYKERTEVLALTTIVKSNKELISDITGPRFHKAHTFSIEISKQRFPYLGSPLFLSWLWVLHVYFEISSRNFE